MAKLLTKKVLIKLVFFIELLYTTEGNTALSGKLLI